MLVEVLHQLNDLVRIPASAMVLLSEPTWEAENQESQEQNAGEVTLFAIAAWLDELISRGEVRLLVVVEFERLAVATMEYVLPIV